MKPVIILSIVCVATVYTRGRWHIGASTSSPCFVMRPRSAKSRSREPDAVRLSPRWLTPGSEGTRSTTCNLEEVWGCAVFRWLPLWGQAGRWGLWAGTLLRGTAVPPQPCPEEGCGLLPYAPGGSCSWRGGSSGCSFGATRAGEPVAPDLMFAKGVIAVSRPAFSQALEENKQMEIRFKQPSPPGNHSSENYLPGSVSPGNVLQTITNHKIADRAPTSAMHRGKKDGCEINLLSNQLPR